MAWQQLDRSQSKQSFIKDRPHNYPIFTPRRKYNSYKPLKALVNEIIKYVRAIKLICFPLPKNKKFPPTNKFKYCKFHKDYGNDTNDYVTLKDEIKSLIKNQPSINDIRTNGIKKRKAEGHVSIHLDKKTLLAHKSKRATSLRHY